MQVKKQTQIREFKKYNERSEYHSLNAGQPTKPPFYEQTKKTSNAVTLNSKEKNFPKQPLCIYDAPIVLQSTNNVEPSTSNVDVETRGIQGNLK